MMIDQNANKICVHIFTALYTYNIYIIDIDIGI